MPADTMPAGSNPGLTQKSLSSIAVVASRISPGSSVEGDELALQVAEARELDLAGPVVEDRLLLEVDVGERGLRVGQPFGVVVVGADGHDRTGARERAGGQDEHDEDDEEDLTERRSGPSLRSALERPSAALAPREGGLHLWPHDSIGG